MSALFLKGATMKEIGFVTNHCCIRVLKEAWVLKKIGYNIHLITGPEIFNSMLANPPRYTPIFKSIQWFNNRQQLETSLRLIAGKTHIFHVHNEPSWLVSYVRDIVNDAVIIFDMHDSLKWRHLKENPEEDLAIEAATSFVVPSEGCKVELSTRVGEKKIIVLPSAVPEDWYVYSISHREEGIVSQGGHTVDPKSWRDYTEIYKKLAGSVKVIACSGEFVINQNAGKRIVNTSNHYSDLGIKLANMKYETLLDAIGGIDWNLVGNWKADPIPDVWEVAVPNKFFDAVAAGTPSFVINAPEVSKIVVPLKIGIAVDTPEEMIERFGESKKCRKKLAIHRRDLAMERFIHRVEGLYN